MALKTLAHPVGAYALAVASRNISTSSFAPADSRLSRLFSASGSLTGQRVGTAAEPNVHIRYVFSGGDKTSRPVTSYLASELVHLIGAPRNGR